MTAGPQELARVVVVDDDRITRDLVREALEPRVRVECCENGEAALEALSREPADLVISDLTMPGLSGIELLERVRRSHPGTQFVILTGDASVESRMKVERCEPGNGLVCGTWHI